MKNIFKFSFFKISYFILITFLCTSTFAQWYQQQSGTTADLRGVWFADSLNGWACGDSGVILKTSNGGQNWEKQNSSVSVKLEDVFFWDLQTGWIVGDSGTIVHTTNGGISWSEQQSNVTSLLHHIQFVSSLTGFASGEQSTALETFDGGLTWQVVSDSGTASVIVYWIQQGLGTIVTGDTLYGFHFCTVDGGLTWFPVGQVLYPFDICGFRVDLTIHPRNYYWDVGIDGSAYWISIIEDLGVVEFILNGVTQDTLDLNAVTLERGVEPFKLWAVGENGWVICSADSGLNWQTISNNVAVDLYEVSFPIKNRGWAVGDSGVILRYDKPTTVNDPSPEEFLPVFYVLDPYPNPFNPKTAIEFYLPQEEKITIVVFNLLGQKVRMLSNEITSEGKHKINFDAAGLPSGIYFFRLSTGRNSVTKKIVLAK